MKKIIFFVFFLVIMLFIALNFDVFGSLVSKPPSRFWGFQSIDTMKYSRDLSREKLNDPQFDSTIELQIKNISQTGATHVAIATPYDAEFLPILKKWVYYARKYNLRVWFRGNWSGWEKWFDYPAIDRKTHIEKTRNFILSNPELFENGDIFSACPECENGGGGDPRNTGDIKDFRNFLIEEYQVTKTSFSKIGKHVQSNYFSMNGDVARVIMDKQTTKALDGIVVIDHYVKSPDQLVFDIKDIAKQSGGKVVLGEFGAPIPDIQGNMSESEQYEWVNDALAKLVKLNELSGVNYWTSVGGTTELWSEAGKERKALTALKNAYNPRITSGIIIDLLGEPVFHSSITDNEKTVFSDFKGRFEIPYFRDDENIRITAEGYNDKTIKTVDGQVNITLENKYKDILFRIRKYFKELVSVF